MSESPPERPEHLRTYATLFIGMAVVLNLGHTLRIPSMQGANDISRWCMVWALVERGTYIIDECPWRNQTQDKVRKPDWRNPGVDHEYSSKPTLLPTVIAAVLTPIRRATGVALDAVVEQPRQPRPDQAKPPDPVRWPANLFYFKPVVMALNIIPYFFFLVMFARWLDRCGVGVWAWMLALAAAALGTPLFLFNTTLNNHTLAAYAAFFAALLTLRLATRGGSAWSFGWAGFWAGWATCNEMPAALFAAGLGVMLLVRDWRRTLFAFSPAALLPCLGFLASQYASFGTVVPVYAEFGTRTYEYQGSYWTAPLEMDALQEPKGVYLFHLLFGHHGFFSLTPILLLGAWTIARDLRGPDATRRGFSALVLLTTAATVGFYVIKSTNYGGTTQGARWLLWLVPLWLLLVPPALEALGRAPKGRLVAWMALFLSLFTVGYGLRGPWQHPWILDALEHLGWYVLTR